MSAEDQYSKVLVQKVIEALEEIVKNINDKKFDYQIEDIQSFVLEKEQNIIYLLETDNSIVTITNETDQNELDSASIITAIIKRDSDWDLTLDIKRQLIVITIPTSFEGNINQLSINNLKLLLDYGVGSYFDLLQQNGKLEDFSQNAVDHTRNKLKRLAIDIQNLQQTIHIPRLLSSLPILIQNWLDDNRGKPNYQIIEESSQLLENSQFLGLLQSLVYGWVRKIQNIIQLDHEPLDGTVSDEINFWSGKENALLSIKEQLDLPEVNLILELLQSNKRSHAAMVLLSGTSLKESLKIATGNNDFLKHLNIYELLSAESLSVLHLGTEQIFEQFKKIKVSKYPVEKAIDLMKIISSNFETTLINIISKNNLFLLESAEFQRIIDDLQQELDSYEKNMRSFTNLLRELLRKRDSHFIPIKIETPVHVNNIMTNIIEIRKMHEDLDSYILYSINNTDSASNAQLQIYQELYNESQTAYESLTKLSMEIVFEKDSYLLNSYKNGYLQQVTHIEGKLVNSIKNVFLALGDNPEALFEVFKKYELLLNKPQVRLMLQQFHSLLLKATENELANVEFQFLHLSKIRDLVGFRNIPKFSSKLYSIKQILHSIAKIFSQLELVLTKDWAQYPEGKRFSAKISLLLQEINIDDMLNTWFTETSKRISSSFLKTPILCSKSLNGENLEFHLNIDVKDLAIAKEIRSLQVLGFEIPKSIISYSHNTLSIQKYATSLDESIRQVYSMFIKADKLDGMKILLLPFFENIFLIFKYLYVKTWSDISKADDLKKLKVEDSKGLEVLEKVQQFQETVLKLSDYNSELTIIKDEFYSRINHLTNCVYDYDHIANTLFQLQTLLEPIILLNSENIKAFVDLVNEKIKNILISKCNNELSKLCTQWNSEGTEFLYDQSVHQLMVYDLSICVKPPLQFSKESFMKSLNSIIYTIKTQKRISHVSYDITETNHDMLFNFKLCDICDVYQRCVKSINERVDESKYFVQRWKSLQILWDIDIAQLEENMGVDLAQWLNLLERIKQIRDTFDTIETSKSFGLIKIDYAQAQSRVYTQFDIRQKSIIVIFAKVIQKHIEKVSRDLIAIKQPLESTIFDLTDSVSIITVLSQLNISRTYLDEHKTHLDNIKTGHSILVKYRFDFPSGWISATHINNLILAINQLNLQNSKFLDSHINVIQSILMDEIQTLTNTALLNKKKWQAQKPNAKTSADSAIFILQNFENVFSKLKKMYTELLHACKLVDLHVDLSIEVELEEIAHLQYIWSIIIKLYSSLDGVKSLEWCDCDINDIKIRLEESLASSRTLPFDIRLYPAFNVVQDEIKTTLRVIPILILLKCDFIEESHWNDIFQHIKLKPAPNVLRIDNILELNLAANEKYIKSILSTAEAEKVLETTIDDIEKSWLSNKFDVYITDSKQCLISGCDYLLTNVEDDMNVLESLKTSTHYPKFTLRVKNFEAKLNTLSQILNIWLEAQKQWVYLLGVFKNKDELAKLIPLDLARFENVSYEFSSLIKSVLSTSIVIDIIDIPDIIHTIERISDVLQKVRNSLSGYLEKQRTLFPRFYFIGNDDLLELIGNSTNPLIISKNIKKIFIGVSTLIYDETAMTIKGIESVEGEIVNLNAPVSLIKNPGLIDWLKVLEQSIKVSLSLLVANLVNEFDGFINLDELKLGALFEKYPNQVLILSFQILWTQNIEKAINSGEYSFHIKNLEHIITLLSLLIKTKLNILIRIKVENLLIELIHKYDVLQSLMKDQITSIDNLLWFSEQKVYFDFTVTDETQNVWIVQGNYSTNYGYEYLGSPKKLAYTPLLTSTFSLLSQSLDQNLGGLLLGPAGTGKTESVKALGYNLGRMVFVFCCDDTFNVESVGRILIGIAQVGAWGCFDEFNRLAITDLSAVSTQVERIQIGLSQENNKEVELLGKSILLNKDVGIFITNNPNYEGRSTLPDNLKSKFLTSSLMVPDSEIITAVLLKTQGFIDAFTHARKVVEFFENMKRLCSNQKHYDFGLRTLKSVVVHAGRLNRNTSSSLIQQNNELQIIQKSCYDVVLPRLVSIDEKIFFEEIKRFGKIFEQPEEYREFTKVAEKVALSKNLVVSREWLSKCMQINEIQKLNHGFMLVGSSCTGKTEMFNCFLEALNLITGVTNETYKLNAKVIDKNLIFGKLDQSTREWKDGIFTSILRKINDNLREKDTKNVWIIFDGDIDPNWVENLNSVLDDNRLLTLPSGERITLHPNVRIVFEVDNLNHATPATVTRCGIISFDKPHFSSYDIFKKKLGDFKNLKIIDEDVFDRNLIPYNVTVQDLRETLISNIYDILNIESVNSLFELTKLHVSILSYSPHRAISNITRFLYQILKKVLIFIESNTYLSKKDFTSYFQKEILLLSFWSFASEFSHADRVDFAKNMLKIEKFYSISDGLDGAELVNICVTLPAASWEIIGQNNEKMELLPHMILGPGVVIPTRDTYTYENLIFSLLNQHEPMILCGPPGSGKTMLLLASIRRSTSFELLNINFSNETTIESVLKSLEQFCVYKKVINGVTMCPKMSSKWLVVFCDELNLPIIDRYGTQKVVQFLRELVIHKGFWHPKDGVWVNMQNIQFVGACNPTSTSGRNFMTNRFTNFCAIIMVDYPSSESLKTIYNTYTTALLRCVPDLIGYSSDFSDSLVEVYLRYKEHFGNLSKPHYISSPRELTRWVKGLYIALKPLITLDLDGLVRLWAHEALRLFSDKLTLQSEKEWVFSMLKNVANIYFPNINVSAVMSTPILYSDWLTYQYQPVDQGELDKFVRERFNIFNQEESMVSVVLYDDLLDHVLRIDRVLKNSQGHMILVGPSGSGKTTLIKFVSWMNGIKIVQFNVSSKFSLLDFEKVLKDLLIRSGINGERICFVIDESTILEDSFLEKMNTLLANAEIPGLFEGDDYDALINLCFKESQNTGVLLESADEAYQWFVQRTAKNLHVFFTMSDPYAADAKPFISSSALFNRCVINWMGTWSEKSLIAVARELTSSIPVDKSDYMVESSTGEQSGLRDVVIDILVFIHNSVNDNFDQEIGPFHFLQLLRTFSSIFTEQEKSLQNLQSHVNRGLDNLRETFLKVKQLRQVLAKKEIELKSEDEKARELLDKMITDQNESERKQDMSMKMQQLFAKQEKAIIGRREIVVKELGEVELLIEEAQKGVLNIKKQHLTELRSMHNPPETIKLVLESICTMLGYSVSTWRDVQHVIRQDDFIANIISFKGEKQLTVEVVAYMQQQYLSKSNFNYESANRASKACGPLFMWVQAQLRFSSIVVKVSPLKDELKKLEDELVDTNAKLIAIKSMIKDLKEEVEKYKLKYSETIRVTENIKMEMTTVKQKIDRSISLLSSLQNERNRWKRNVSEYEKQKEALVGDTIIASAFITYCGQFFPTARSKLLESWKNILKRNRVSFGSDINNGYMQIISSAETTLEWQKFGLPNDEQFIGNAAILRSPFNNRYSFIIDPSGLVKSFLTKLVEPKKQLVITSFLDPGFNKKLENCVKFGGSILIEDGEHFDPVISRLIAKDVNIMGASRMVIELGDREIDMSPDFELFIHTRDSSLKLLPFISSRMNILNFSFTTDTIINECLNLTLQVKEPEVESKRLELMKITNECKLRIRNFETELLDLMSSSKDTILEDDNLLSKLELIKKETKTLEFQLTDAKTMMHNYNDIRDQFKPLGELYAKLTVFLNELSTINKVYQFSTDYLKVLLLKSLKNNPVLSVEESKLEFAKLTYNVTSVSLLQKDKYIFKDILQHCIGVNTYDSLTVDETVINNQLILLRSFQGNDSSAKIKELALSLNIETVIYSLGSNDGYDIANRLIVSLKESEKWVIIENIEMSSDFLTLITETLTLLKSSEEGVKFKLILTCKVDSDIPLVLMHSCKQLIIENEQGVKSGMVSHLLNENSWISLSKTKNLQPKEIKKVYFVLVWFYSLIISLLRFGELGFKRRYELNQTDLRNAGMFIMKFVRNRYDSNESGFEMNDGLLEIINWFVCGLIFGGKFDDTLDLEKLVRCGNKLFNRRMFGSNFNLLCFEEAGENMNMDINEEKLLAPEGYDTMGYSDWIRQLPEPEPLLWLGLSEEAEKQNIERVEMMEKKAVSKILEAIENGIQ